MDFPDGNEVRRDRSKSIVRLAWLVVVLSLVVILSLDPLGLSAWVGLALSVFPASLLWNLGYRGSLIQWGDGWTWLTSLGVIVVYGPIVAALAWFTLRYRRRSARRKRAID